MKRQFLTVPEAAHIAGVSERTMGRDIKDGHLIVQQSKPHAPRYVTPAAMRAYLDYRDGAVRLGSCSLIHGACDPGDFGLCDESPSQQCE